MDDEKYSIKSVARCLKILDLASSFDRPLTINDVCDSLGININMAFRMLSTLTAAGYLIKNEKTGFYSVSLRALHLSRNALLSLDVRKFAMPYLEMLWNQYPNANINLAIYYEGEVMLIDRYYSLNIPRTFFYPGKTVPFHCTALGKVLTCELSEAEIDRLIAEKGLKSFTPKTITNPAELKADLARARAEHLARDREEFIIEDNCNAVPIRNQEGNIIAAISLAAFESYMPVQEVEETIPALRNTAHCISSTMGYQNGII